MSKDKITRIDYLDSLKGFAIILVVLGHICVGYNAARMYPLAKEALAAIYKAIYMFHMPLFMTISGYVFHAAYFTKDGKPQRVRIFQQTLNLVLTCLLFSVMLGLLKMAAVAYTNSITTWGDIQLIPVRPISPYWYLYVLATLYAVFSAGWAVLCRMPSFVLLPILAFLSVRGSLIGTEIWCELGRSLYYSFFFGLGVVLHRPGRKIPVNVITTPLFGVGAGVLVGIFWRDGRPIDLIPVVNLVVGVLLSLFFWGVFSRMRFLAKNRVLRFVGSYSLEIYVLHCVFTAGHRPILQWFGVGSALIGTVLNLIDSVLIPILLGVTCKRLGLHGLLFRPVSYFCHKSLPSQTDNTSPHDAV